MIRYSSHARLDSRDTCPCVDTLNQGETFHRCALQCLAATHPISDHDNAPRWNSRAWIYETWRRLNFEIARHARQPRNARLFSLNARDSPTNCVYRFESIQFYCSSRNLISRIFLTKKRLQIGNSLRFQSTEGNCSEVCMAIREYYAACNGAERWTLS